MTALQRGFLCALAAPTLLFGACRAHPDFARRVNLDVWALPELERQIEQGRREYEREGGEVRAARERGEERGRAVDDLIAGRIGLREAVARFHECNRANPASERVLQYLYPDESDEERRCRQVMFFVETRMRGTPTAEADRVEARLAEELGEHLRRESTVQLSQ